MSEAAESRIASLFDDGRRAWSGVRVEEATFAAFVRERAGEDADLAALHGADLYLACACAAGDPAALAAFEARYMADVPSFLARVEHASAVIEDVSQLVRERLFVAADGKRPKILDYSGRGSLGSWLRVVTLRVAMNRRRADRA